MFEAKFGFIPSKVVTVENGILSLGSKVKINVDEIEALYVTPPTMQANGTVYISQDGVIAKDLLTFQKNSFNYIKKQADAVSEFIDLIEAPVMKGVSTVEMGKKAINEAKSGVSATKQAKNTLKCPSCGHENIEFAGNKRKGFSVGKAVVGGALTGGIGTLAGFVGGKGKKNQFVCMNCGKTFTKKA